MKSHILLVDTDKDVIRCFTDAFVKSDYPYKCIRAENVNHARQITDFLVPEFVLSVLTTILMKRWALFVHYERFMDSKHQGDTLF